VPTVIEAVLAAGGLDCTAIPTLMKKGRPGVRLEALAPPDRLEAVTGALFAAGTTLGVRHWPAARHLLPRRMETVTWRGQEIRVKRVALPGGGERAKPEFEDIARAAAALGLTPLAVYRALLAEGVAVDA
jgi:pyridinium-3,5-bisthiocarboxylic acid mononucleotide nickel chelatase